MNNLPKKGTVVPVIEKGPSRKVIIIVVNAECSAASHGNLTQHVLGLLPVLSVVSTIPVSNFSDAELGYLRAYVQNLEQQRNTRDKVVKLVGMNKMEAKTPELAEQDVSYHAIDIEFGRLEDPQERTFLNNCPTG